MSWYIVIFCGFRRVLVYLDIVDDMPVMFLVLEKYIYPHTVARPTKSPCLFQKKKKKKNHTSQPALHATKLLAQDKHQIGMQQEPNFIVNRPLLDQDGPGSALNTVTTNNSHQHYIEHRYFTYLKRREYSHTYDERVYNSTRRVHI